jgi:hypothetical protein
LQAHGRSGMKPNNSKLAVLSADRVKQLAKDRNAKVYTTMYERPEKRFAPKEAKDLCLRIMKAFDVVASAHPGLHQDVVREMILKYSVTDPTTREVTYPIRALQRSMPKTFADITRRASTPRTWDALNKARYFVVAALTEKMGAMARGESDDHAAARSQSIAMRMLMRERTMAPGETVDPQLQAAVSSLKPLSINASMVVQPRDDWLSAMEAAMEPYDTAKDDQEAEGEPESVPEPDGVSVTQGSRDHEAEGEPESVPEPEGVSVTQGSRDQGPLPEGGHAETKEADGAPVGADADGQTGVVVVPGAMPLPETAPGGTATHDSDRAENTAGAQTA